METVLSLDDKQSALDELLRDLGCDDNIETIDPTPKLAPKKRPGVARDLSYCRKHGIAETTEAIKAAPVESKSAPVSVPTKTPAPLPDSASVKHGEKYHFPIEQITVGKLREKYLKFDNEQLIRAVEVLAAKTSVTPTRYAPYRNDLCAIALILNDRKAYMPVIRPMPKGDFSKAGKPASDEDALIANDKRVIDLHWLCKNAKQSHHRTAGLFVGDEFNFDAASDFVSHRGKDKEKANLLGLSTFDDVPLAMIRSEETRNRWANLLKNKSKDIAVIAKAKQANHNRLNACPEWLWEIYALNVLCEAHIPQILKYEPMMGHPATPQHKVRKALGWLKKNTKLLG